MTLVCATPTAASNVVMVSRGGGDCVDGSVGGGGGGVASGPPALLRLGKGARSHVRAAASVARRRTAGTGGGRLPCLSREVVAGENKKDQKGNEESMWDG